MRHITIFFILVTYLSSGICPLYSTMQQNESIQPKLRSTYEIFPNGHGIRVVYNVEGRPICISISNIVEIGYEYSDGKISKIHRLDSNGKILYTHTYLPHGKERMIGNLGFIERCIDGLIYACKTPYSLEICKYDENGNIIERVVDDEIISYDYDEENHLIYGDNDFQDKLYSYDGLPLVYDEQGNLIQKQNTTYTYDTDNRLIDVITEDSRVSFTYDNQNRRVSKKVETKTETYEQTYLYYRNIPIAIFKNGVLEQLSIPNCSRFDTIAQAIAIETTDAIYAPIYDIQWNISKLVNIDTKEVYPCTIDPFGKNIEQQNLITPWLFCTKEYDPETSLVYFGLRYYAPNIQRWLTQDPLHQDMNNLYTYCFNNPLHYIDPDGRFTIVIPLIDLTFGVIGKAIVKGLFLGGAAWLGAKGVKKTDEYLKEKEKRKENARRAEAERQLQERAQFTEQEALDKTQKKVEESTKGFPDRPLPKTEDGVPIPDTDAPHSQLGVRKGRKSTYGKAREFDADGKPVRDIEFTDHGRPQNHPNPHQHRYQENNTGGSRERIKRAESVPEWSYE